VRVNVNELTFAQGREFLIPLSKVLYSVGVRVHVDKFTLWPRYRIHGRGSCKWTHPWPRSPIW